MKKITKPFLILFLFTVVGFTNAQVGIGTTSPEGILDIKSSTYGFVYPSAALTSTALQAPVVNPMGGTLAVGTTIFNTNRTNTGTNDVSPGIYAWDGNEWVTHYYKKETTLFKQTTELRTSSNVGYQGIPGLDVLSANVFIPNYSGVYKIEMRGYFGGGRVRNNRGMHTVTATGNFKLSFDGTDYIIDTKSFSSYHPDVSGGKYYEDVWRETVIIKYVTLTANIPYLFDVSFDQTSTQSNRGFEWRGNLLNGRGHIGSEVPCSVEFTYLN